MVAGRLEARGIEPCIPSSRSRKIPYDYDKVLYRQRPQAREPVRQAQGLAAHRHPLPPLRTHLLLGNLHRCRRHLLACASARISSTSAQANCRWWIIDPALAWG
jgi:hypothetical protein